MDLESKRVSRKRVGVGSVWESRMKGSFKVFNNDDNKNQKIETNNEIAEMEKVVLRSKQSCNEVINGGGKRKTWKSEGNSEETERSPAQITKARSENKKVLSEMSKELGVSIDGNGIKKIPIQTKKGRPEWNRTIKTRSLPRREITSSDLCNGIEKAKSLPTKRSLISDESNLEIEEIRSHSSQTLEELDVVCDEKLMTDDMGISDTQDYATMEENEEKSIVVVKEMEPEVVIEEKKIHQKNEKSSPISKTIKKQPSPVINHPRIISKPNEFPSHRGPKSHNKLQTFIDLIMWRDASKSSLIFGLGTFSILSSSYTQDLNISFISVISYMGLIYLAAIFIFRSFIFRGVVEADRIRDDDDDDECVVGEEEAIWALKLFLPYINEFLLKVKALFSGDPLTTMKLAVLLFILARCGSSITIWKMVKLGFLAVFTVPKICSLYSSQLTAYGTFWVERFKDAWESCSQKKAVAFGVFALVWNFSSIVVHIWAVFMLLVAFKYYQQSKMKDEVELEEELISRRNQSSGQQQRNTEKRRHKAKEKILI